MINENFKTGYVAIVGEPNTGKSTLLNSILGVHLSIVSKKPQTTRKNVMGIYSNVEAQIIFTDTPGVLSPTYLLQEKMLGYIEHALGDTDVVLLMLDMLSPDFERLAETALGGITKLGKPVILVLNKVDALDDRNVTLPVIEKYNNMKIFKEIVPISALKNDNVELLTKLIIENLPVGEILYDPEQVSDQPQRFFVSELIREQAFKMFKKELPYSVEIEIIKFQESNGKDKTRITADIIVERESQKGIVIGKGGSMLKLLGTNARLSIEEFLGEKIYLELFVKVKEGWKSNESRLKGFGY
ncbi:MAG: GTPase Era [Candidatus Kapaibacterium sp.]